MTTALTNQSDPMTAFREKILEKLRTDIGSLMPEEALAGLVQQAVETEFFKRQKEVDRYGHTTSDKPSWFVQEVAKLGEPIIREHVSAWMVENKSVLEQAIKTFLDEKNLLLLLMAAINQQTQAQVFQIANELIRQSKYT